MLSKKLFSSMHKIALFAIVFASLAPSISHALAAQQGVNTLTQAICTTNGEIITIQVVTTKGQQLATNLEAEKESQSSTSILHHLNHCPFCANPKMDNVIAAIDVPLVAVLETQAEALAVPTQAVLPRFSILPPPAQAPPSLN